MTRRTSPPQRCAEAGCVHLGYWPRGYCPVHHIELVEQLRAAIARHRDPDPQAPPGTVLGGPTEGVHT